MEKKIIQIPVEVKDALSSRGIIREINFLFVKKNSCYSLIRYYTELSFVKAFRIQGSVRLTAYIRGE